MLFKKILIDAQTPPKFLDFNDLSHHRVYTQTSNILIAVSHCVNFKYITNGKIEEIANDILLYISQIKIEAGDDISYKVYKWIISKLRVYESYSNMGETYEYSNNILRLINTLDALIKNIPNGISKN